MDEGANNISNAWNDESSGKRNARREMNIPTPRSATLSSAEAAASAHPGADSPDVKSAENVNGAQPNQDAFRWTGGNANAGQSSHGKINARKALPLVAILLLVIVATGVISFLGNSTQLFSLLAQMLKKNKLVAVSYTSAENQVTYSLKSSDPADRLSDYMIQVFADYGLEYIEQSNNDGTVARALIYQAGSDDPTLIASAQFKDQLMNTVSVTGSVISQYRDLATVADGEDQAAAAWYGALSVVSAGAWYDDSADLTYSRLGLNPSKFNSTDSNPTDSAIVDAAKAGSASEDVNNNTGTTTRYVWTKHEYQYCEHWDPEYGEDGTTIIGHICKAENIAKGEVWDWDNDSSLAYDQVKYPHTTDPFPDTATAAETCDPWGSCGTEEEQSNAADPKPFTGDEIATRITSEDDKSAVQDALGKRAVLSAFSTYPDSNSSGQVTTTKSDASLISALTSMIKNKTTNFANNIVVATDKAKAGYGGNEMNYYGNLLNTPAESCDANGEQCSTMAATESSSFNSWFSDDIIVSADNPIVQKYNVANTLANKGITDIVIDSEYTGNYNNMDNTIANTYTAENLSNSSDSSGEAYNYCQASSGSVSKLCPFGHQTLTASDYSSRVSDEVATYAYALTSIDLNADPVGEESMVAFNEGITLLNDAMLKQSSGTYGDEEMVLSSYRMEQNYLAKLANYERQTKSPLDVSSSNTFLGSIVSSLLPFFTTTRNNTFFSAISATSTVINSSIVSLLPSAAASSIDEITYLNEQTTTDCVAYKSSGMLCYADGNPIVVMDQTYMATDPAEIEQKMEEWGYVESGSCDTKEGCKIKEDYDTTHKDNSDEPTSYTQWLLCTQNDTSVNNNITTEKSSRTENNGGILQSILSFLSNIFNKNRDSVRNQTSCGGNYTGGRNEVASLDGTLALSQNDPATRYKIFAQFTLNQRIKSLLQYQEENTVTAYLRQYYTEHPLDQSYEGIIARQAGLTVAEVQQAFADMEYAVYLARYDSSSRYQFVEPQSELELSLAQTDYDTMKVAAVIGKIQDFEELRARNFAA